MKWRKCPFRFPYRELSYIWLLVATCCGALPSPERCSERMDRPFLRTAKISTGSSDFPLCFSSWIEKLGKWVLVNLINWLAPKRIRVRYTWIPKAVQCSCVLLLLHPAALFLKILLMLSTRRRLEYLHVLTHVLLLYLRSYKLTTTIMWTFVA